MSSDTLLGFLLAIPLYAIIMFLFKDIVVKRFLNMLINNSTVESVPTKEVLDCPGVANAVEKDMLTSYKLLLILRDEFKYLASLKAGDFDPKYLDVMTPIFKEKYKSLDTTIRQTEEMFDAIGTTEYTEIKNDLLGGPF